MAKTNDLQERMSQLMMNFEFDDFDPADAYEDYEYPLDKKKKFFVAS